ncbi:MAG: SDR family oxidoreductase [Candidatus Parcubacteria bacterium]|nr:SDR family oxidoreductase [Candidatus Parcubacteria bacterium]
MLPAKGLLFRQKGQPTDPEATKAFLAKIPMHRIGKSEEVSSLVLFLASDDASYITGSTMIVDGGWMAN